MDGESKRAMPGGMHKGTSNKDWWPNQANLKSLHPNPPAGIPMGEDFNYAKAVKTLDLDEVRPGTFGRPSAAWP
jgi:catalase-peroxidase